MHGYHGAYLRFDLTRGEGVRVPIPESMLRRYLGGVGLGTWILLRESPAGVDPLAPAAPLVFAFSPLVGTPVTTSAKFAVVARSPLTGRIGDALSSSHFAIAGKRMGVDALVFVGACSEPSVWLAGRLEPTTLWGRSAADTERALSEHGRVAAIGPAGERLVRFATLSNEGRHAGRGGLGAVLGAKQLKAVVVRGDHEVTLADPRDVARRARTLAQRAAGEATAKYRDVGTVGNLLAFSRVGALPSRNFASGDFAGAERLSAESLQPSHETGRRSCAACTIGCEHRYRTGDTDVRVEYESLYALGPLCGVSDPDLVLEAVARCNAAGIDTISAGATMAFAMECGERGYLDGAPRFEDGPGLLRCLDDIALRRGLGDLLAEGSRRVAVHVGHDSLDFAPQVKGLELPGYEPRALHTLGLGLAVGTRGADHNKSGAYELDFSDRVDRFRGDEPAARLAVESETRAALFDSLILCKFVRRAFDDVFDDAAPLLRAVTGWDVDGAELHAIACRVVDLRKAFNMREGWEPTEDTLPPRLLREPLPDGAAAQAQLSEPRLMRMVGAYNRARGWSVEGFVPEERLRVLARDLPEGALAPAAATR